MMSFDTFISGILSIIVASIGSYLSIITHANKRIKKDLQYSNNSKRRKRQIRIRFCIIEIIVIAIWCTSYLILRNGARFQSILPTGTNSFNSNISSNITTTKQSSQLSSAPPKAVPNNNNVIITNGGNTHVVVNSSGIDVKASN